MLSAAWFLGLRFPGLHPKCTTGILWILTAALRPEAKSCLRGNKSGLRGKLAPREWARTTDLTVNSRPLYQLSYRGMERADGFEPSSSSGLGAALPLSYARNNAVVAAVR